MAVPEGSSEVPAWLQTVGAVALFAGTIAGQVWKYLRGVAEPDEVKPRHVILEQAEIADMHAVRSIAPQLTRIVDTLQQIYQIAQDNHRIVEQNHEMLRILQRLDRDMDVREEVRDHDRQRMIDDFIASQKARQR